jgi:hypothetical protein
MTEDKKKKRCPICDIELDEDEDICPQIVEAIKMNRPTTSKMTWMDVDRTLSTFFRAGHANNHFKYIATK